MPAPLPPTVRRLGLVSLLNDVSSEMIYPLLPAFLTGPLRAGPAFLGLVEGVAEAAASLLKLASGWLTDRLPRRLPLVIAGYTLSSAVRPLVAAAQAPWHVLAVRTADRVGKGTRGAPRDALLAEATPARSLGRAFGFHRAMDHTGALAGPLAASALLGLGLGLRGVFAAAALPAIASVLALALVREPDRPLPAPQAGPDGGAVTGNAPRLTGAFARYLLVLGVFTLGNSSDAFLLLRAQELGVGIAAVPLLWTLHHVAKASASTHAGALSDRLGRRAAIVAGWVVYAVSYAGLAAASQPVHAWLLFALYGLHHALTEGPERALVTELAPAGSRGWAFGLYHTITGVLLLPASLLTGWLWEALGAQAALGLGAALAALAAVGLVALVPERTG